jgi:hypothetical protein
MAPWAVNLAGQPILGFRSVATSSERMFQSEQNTHRGLTLPNQHSG